MLYENDPPSSGHVCLPIRTIFELNRHLTKNVTSHFLDWAKIVTYRVFTSDQFKLGRGIIGTNLWTKFHEDWTKTVASRVFTSQNVDDERRTHDGRRTIGDPKSSP
ncbi:hypothetical protein DPMN_077579 [Dreissena polymorpha]|uniref:Uncharacterized protein n=1 Tax=Dreissena polymorpha TaxID=45954 RepID=A0A9D4BGR8_DREPO|nr:hypothetical protein DPMN_077579 [Dreissena polymorpha]